MVKKNVMTKADILPNGFATKDLVNVPWTLVQKLFKHLEGREIRPADIPQWKLALGFTNATNHAVKTSMQYFSLTSLPEAVKMLKKAVKKRKY